MRRDRSSTYGASPPNTAHNTKHEAQTKMPIYEFYCPANNKVYSFFARSLSYAKRVPRCPENEDFRMEKMISRFATRKKGSDGKGGDGEDGGAGDPFAGLDDSQMGSAMMELEREMGGMDEENPDPRQIGRFMRKMCDMTGQEMAGPMEEMVERMEKGEDAEALEAEYSDVLDGDAIDFLARKAGLRNRRPKWRQRDPVLYEMSEWLKVEG